MENIHFENISLKRLMELVDFSAWNFELCWYRGYRKEESQIVGYFNNPDGSRSKASTKVLKTKRVKNFFKRNKDLISKSRIFLWEETESFTLTQKYLEND